MMFWIRSGGIVEAVCSTGTRLPGASSRFAVPGRQSRKYSPIGDCGRDSQNTSERSEPKPFSVISTSTSAFWVRSSSFELQHLAGVRAGHAHVAALDQAERVVELHGVAAAVASPPPAARARASAATAATTQDRADEPPHRPGGTWVGSQLKSGEGLSGVEPSPVSRSAEPGQRLFWPSTARLLNDSARSAGAIGAITPFLNENAFTWVPIRAKPPIAS